MKHLAFLIFAYGATSAVAGPFKFLMMMQDELPTPAPAEEGFSTETVTANDLASDLKALEIELSEARAEKDKVLQEFESYKADSSERLDRLTRNSEASARIAQVQQDFTQRIAKMQQEARDEISALKSTIEKRDADILSAKEALIAAAAEADQKCINEMSKLSAEGDEPLRDAQLTVSTLQADITRLVAEKSTIQDMYTLLQNKWEAKLQETEQMQQIYFEERFQAELPVKTAEIEKIWSEKVTQMKTQHENSLASLREELQAAHSKAIKAEQEIIASLEDQVQSLRERASGDAAMIRSLQGMQTASQNEAQYWKEIFLNRHFFNATFAGEKLVVVREGVSASAVRLQEKGNKLYDEHLKSHVDELEKHLRPHYENYLLPLAVAIKQNWGTFRNEIDPYLSQLKGALSSATQLVKSEMIKAFNFLVGSFEEICPDAIAFVSSLEDKLTAASPAVQWLEECCRESTATVLAFLKVLAFILVIILRRRVIYPVLRAFIWVCLYVFDTIWNLSPLRLIFGPRRKKRRSLIKSPTANGIPRKKIPSDPAIKKEVE